MRIKPDSFRDHEPADLSHIIDDMPTDYRTGEWTGYTPKQLHDYAETRRNELLEMLFIIDVVLGGLTLIFFWGAWL